MEKLIKLVREGYDRDKLVNKIVKPIKDKEKMFPKSKKEASGDKEEYQKFFKAAMKKFGVESPAELKGDKEKEFYNYIDKNWKGDHEESVELALEFGTPNMSDADKANLRRRIKDMQKSKKKESVTEATLNPNDNVDQFLSQDLMNQTALTAYLRKIFKIGEFDFNNAIYFYGADLVSGSKTVLRNVIGNKRLKVSDLIKALEKKLKKKAIKESVGTNGQSLEADEQGRGLSPKAQFVKSMMNPEVAADANKTALQTFAAIMNSVSAKGAPRSGDNTEQDLPEAKQVSTEAVFAFGPFVFSKNTSDDELLNMYHAAQDAYNSGYRLMYPRSDYKKAITQMQKMLKKRRLSTELPIGDDDAAMLSYRAALSKN